MLGLRQALNMALAECWALDRVPLATTGAVSYDISSLGDWLDPDAIHELYGPSISGMPDIPFGSFVTRADANVTNLDVIGLATGYTVNLELTRPGDTFMKTAGVWTDNQMGFTVDSDECLFQPAFITEVALFYCYEALANATTGPAAARYLSLAQDKRRNANIMKLRGLPHPPERAHTGWSIGDDWVAYIR